MDVQKFIQQLPNFYENWEHETVQPKSDQFQQRLEQINPEVSVNFMQLLNVAVECLEASEMYCEVGTQDGISLIAALLGHPEKMAYAVSEISDNDSLEQLVENVQLFNLEEQIIFCNQDFESFLLELREVETDSQIGVYYYQALSDYRSVLMSLLLVRPFLANQAIILVNSADKGTVQQAIWDFMAAYPQCKILLDGCDSINLNQILGTEIQVLSWNAEQTFNYSVSNFQDQQSEQVIHAIQSLQQLEPEVNISQIYNEAINSHEQKQYKIAEQKYKKFLQWQPNHAEAWHQLSILYYEVENYRESVQAILKSLEIDSSIAVRHYHLGLGLERIEKYSEAITAYQTAIELDNSLVYAYQNLGNLIKQQGSLTEAEAIYRKAIEVNPNHWGSYLNLGNILLEQTHFEDAIAIYQTALTLNPEAVEVQQNLNLAEAAKENPAPIYYTFAQQYYQQGKYNKAIQFFQNYLELQPGEVELYATLSDCFNQIHQPQEAIKVLQTGTQVHPTSGQLHFSLILQLLRQGETEAAISQAETAFNYLPNDYTFKLLKHLIVPIIYHHPESINYYRKRFEQELQTLIQTTRLETPAERESAFWGLSRWTNFYLAYQAHNVVESQKNYGNLVHNIMAANYPNWVKPLTIPKVEQKIRVGYVSHYLHSYSGTLWLTGWLRFCNHNNFEVYCYYTSNTPDPITQIFRQYSDIFHHIPGNFAAVCQQILDDQLHILVYPEIGMDAPTMQMAALRLAPVQCTAWGHPVTTGLPTIDYFLSSQLMEPENAQEHYSETLVRLPNIGVAYPQPKDIPNLTKSRSYFNISEDSVLYFCCQAPFKYLPQYDYILPEIALNVPNAKFLFLRGTILIPRLERAFAAASLNHENYCIHLSIPERSDYLMLNLLSDVFLDTFTWSGGNTSLEAIACNLPIVTCPGEFMRGRHADSFLKLLGVTDTIAKNEAEYINIAVKLGLDSAWRQDISQRMSQQQDNLFEDETCVKALEEFYRQVVRNSQ
ncbi:tetratricopeptide repeat protein [Lyngbya sp. PCC 8106]|uniref:O-linked N-acetylglucosamine transferase, SPINDLY family protein n=1 Tax=Lyngbya sp. (strain PCC 8106) TaxID=313612 RepID=UPI0000EA9F66|nr:tetratricopeptide repeat protein [Lyngbya sp. PCC 8106]EAW36725.1 TPR repeat protein [Lyngbya sp. PCC 8106]